ncbi:MarR family transcriptional regulator [Sphingobium lactosutens]|uniref:MarR family winged helix-turn-helix transcriptional regulator n=1 Tax=Sphingobium lactosutens TaxID=522773 RepID=UPI0015BD71BD|nr:MarR family transcriptional regulator [Sphingobium lactosutens]NWK96611.1 MarR family transcriptional regulator [Sphingobium lactosutens]
MSKVLVSTDQTLFVRDHCLCLATQRAARSLSRRFDEAFRSLGLTSGQFSLLNALNRPQPPSVGSVAHLLAMDRTTLTANLKPLERDGLVRTEADSDDRRVRRLVLTEAGRQRLASAMPIWIAVHGEIDAGLTDAGALRSGLAALR